MNRYALDVSFSSQNCNSLNVSTSVRNQAAKIVSILDLVSEIIFLCDIRLNGRHCAISDALRNKYKMYYHSSMNRRGVAILIKNDLDLQVLEEFRDTEENGIILRVRLRGIELLIGSVYGPNTNQFLLYDFLQASLNRWRGLPAVLGGDWNTTFSNLPVNTNPDVFSMRAEPSAARTERILQICEEFNLTDPYRMLQPEGRDYMYIPSGVLRTNRSHIDYFLISDELIQDVGKCKVAPSLCKKSFNHKNISLCFKKRKKKGRKCINNRILTNPLLECGIKLSIWECYLASIRTEAGVVTEALVQEECLKLHDIDLMFNEAVFLQGKAKAVGNSEEEQRREADLVRRLDESWTRVIPYDGLQQYPRNCDDNEFFEKLIEKTSKAAFKMQKLSSEAENFVRKSLLEKLRELKHNNNNVPDRQN